MFKKTMAVFATAIVLSVSSIVAQAATTFDFQSNRSGTPSFDMSVDGIDLTVSAARFTNAGDVIFSGKVQSSVGGGLGITSNANDSDPDIDGRQRNDLAVFDFSQNVKFESVTFLNLDNDDEYSFFMGDPLVSLGYNFAINSDLSASNYISAFFGIGAKDGGEFSIDDFTIASITVTAVPLPSSVLLFGGALLGLGWLSRHKLKSAATA